MRTSKERLVENLMETERRLKADREKQKVSQRELVEVEKELAEAKKAMEKRRKEVEQLAKENAGETRRRAELVEDQSKLEQEVQELIKRRDFEMHEERRRLETSRRGDYGGSGPRRAVCSLILSNHSLRRLSSI